MTGAGTRRRWRTLLVSCGVACALAGATAGGVAWGRRLTARPAAAPTGPAATAGVTRTTLTRSTTLTGQLTYGPTTPLASAAAGVVTWLPAVGDTITRGEAVLRADDAPVVLLYGDLPVYRPMALNTTGNDVYQFERNLAALGYRGFTVDRTYSASTVAAVKRWQKRLARPQTGTVDASQLVVAPGPLRVAQRLVRVGGTATADVLSYTAAIRMVSVQVPSAQAGWVRVGAKVTVRPPGGGAVGGTVHSVGAPAASGSVEAGAPQSPDRATGDQGTEQSALDVLVRVADPGRLAGPAATPVDVVRTLQQRRNVLTVPVSALLALAEGGYGLEIVTVGTSRTVAVQVGMFANGRVEVSGGGLAEGQQVGVPA